MLNIHRPELEMHPFDVARFSPWSDHFSGGLRERRILLGLTKIEMLSSTRLLLNKWFRDNCSGRGRLTFPIMGRVGLGFDTWATYAKSEYARGSRIAPGAKARTCPQSPNRRWPLNKSIQMTPRPDWNRIMQRLLRAQRALVTDAPRTQCPWHPGCTRQHVTETAATRGYITKFGTPLRVVPWFGMYNPRGRLLFVETNR